jgi:hypothetical protein
MDQLPPVVARSSNHTALFECVCPDCGKVRIQDRRKLGKPCPACSAVRRRTHGLCKDPLYKLLKNLQVRCNYPSASNYEYYGAKGVKVCDEWANDPAAFVKWARENGYRPGLEIDRIDVNGPYAPANCRFLSHAENSRRRSNSRCDAETAATIKQMLAGGARIQEVASATGVPYMSVWHISKGNTWR